MKFPWWWSDNHEKKTDERRIETTFGEHDVCYPKQNFLFFSSPSFFRPFLFSSAYVNNYRVCRECVYFKHITETICLEKKKKKKKKKKREKRGVVLIYI